MVDGKHRDQVLLSPVILKEILKYLDFPRLRSSRLTSKLWDREICRVLSLSNSAHVHLFAMLRSGLQDELRGSKFRSTFQSREPEAVPYPFRDLSFNPLGNSIEDSTWLYTNFRVTEIVIRKVRGYITPEMGKYALSVIQGCSTTLRKLECPYLGDWDAGESLRDGKLEFPVLEQLQPFSIKYYYQWPSQPSTQEQVDFFSKIISSSPTLVGLKLINYAHLKLLLERVSLNRVQKLELFPTYPVDPEIWNVLERVELGNLAVLKLRNCGNDISPTRCCEILSLFRDSLQRLSITFTIANFPLCPALTRLELQTLEIDVLDWSKLPNLRHVKCIGIGILDLNRNEIVPALSVRKLSNRGSRPQLWNSGDESMDESLRLEATFSKLFQWFPNATAWKVHHKDAMPFCKAVRGSQQQAVRKFSLILDERKCNGDRDLTHVIDRYMFSLLPYLDEMEELVLENCTTSPGMEMKLAEIDFSKLVKLKCLKVYNYDPPEEECAVLGRIPKVLMVSSGSAKWSRPITSMPNVEFRQVLSKDRRI